MRVPAASESPLSFGLMGRPWAVAGGTDVAVPPGQAWLLLAYLLERRGRSVERSELVAALWPGEPPASADVAVRALLSRLRAVLGRELLTGRGCARVEPLEDVWLDVDELCELHRRVRRAVRAGEPGLAAELASETLQRPEQQYLAGLDVPWVHERRRELENLREEALAILAQSALALGDPWLLPGRRAARDLAERRPFSEGAIELLMRLEVAAGDTPLALLAYEDLRRRLRTELDVVPGGRLRDLHITLLGDAPTAEAARHRSLGTRRCSHTSRRHSATYAYAFTATVG
jgi:DNA-binding SARP family transcriptional activator